MYVYIYIYISKKKQSNYVFLFSINTVKVGLTKGFSAWWCGKAIAIWRTVFCVPRPLEQCKLGFHKSGYPKKSLDGFFWKILWKDGSRIHNSFNGTVLSLLPKKKTKKGKSQHYHRIVTNNQRLASISWCFNSTSIFLNGISQPPLMTEDSPSDPGFTEPKLFSLRGGCARCWVHAMPWGSFAMSYMSCHHTKNLSSGKLKQLWNITIFYLGNPQYMGHFVSLPEGKSCCRVPLGNDRIIHGELSMTTRYVLLDNLFINLVGDVTNHKPY